MYIKYPLLFLLVLVLFTGCSARLDVPQNLSVSLVDGELGTLLLEWSPVPNADGYVVQYGLENAFDMSSGKISGTSWKASGLNTYQTDQYKLGNRDEYNFRVAALNVNGKQGKASETITGRAEVPSVKELTVRPGRQRQLIVNWTHTPGSSHVNLRWGPSSDIGETTDEGHTFGESPQGTYIITGLDDGKEYYVWVQTAAMLDQNDSSQWFDGRWSKGVSATTITP